MEGLTSGCPFRVQGVHPKTKSHFPLLDLSPVGGEVVEVLRCGTSLLFKSLDTVSVRTLENPLSFPLPRVVDIRVGGKKEKGRRRVL